jgi:hypothetical protein
VFLSHKIILTEAEIKTRVVLGFASMSTSSPIEKTPEPDVERVEPIVVRAVPGEDITAALQEAINLACALAGFPTQES